MTKPRIGPLVGERVRLRPLEEGDLEMTRRWRNQPGMRRWFLYSGVISAEQHRAWFRSYIDRPDDFVFVIEQDPPHRPIGQVSLYRLKPPSAEFGRLMIGEPSARRQGLAREANELLLDYAFAAWPLDHIDLEVKAGNAAAISLYLACGFVESSVQDNVVRMTLHRDRRGGKAGRA